MSKQDIYVLFLCLIVFTALTVVSIALLATIVKLTVRLIVHGAEDENIRKEFEERATHPKRAGAIIDFVVSAVFTCALLVVFCFSIFVNLTEKTYFENIPTLKVVQTGSMSYKHEKNTYLEQNGLHDQFDAFDLIFTYKLPDEMELELYDIVVYEVDDILLVHRIVGIEEPNTRHPNERHFLLQGDAVENPDRFPVLYSQMRGIYRGERIPFAGSFVNFMQSPAGWLCVLLAVTALIATPIIEKHLETAKLERWLLIKGKDGEEEAEEENPSRRRAYATESATDCACAYACGGNAYCRTRCSNSDGSNARCGGRACARRCGCATARTRRGRNARFGGGGNSCGRNRAFGLWI